MKNRIHAVTVLVALVIGASASHAMAQSMTGGFAVGEDGSYTSSSLQLSTSGTAITQGGTDDFLNIGFLANESTGTITGISPTTTPLTLGTLATPVQGFFSVSVGSDLFGFELTQIGENTSASDVTFYGSGILTDSDSAYTPTDATFTLAFSGSTSSSFSLDTVATPEPTSWMLGSIAAVAFVVLGYRRRAVRS